MNKFRKHVTPIKGLFIIEPRVFGDSRGFFLESYNKLEFEKLGIFNEFIQDNHSKSTKGVLRGLHFQIENEQTKLVRVIRGEVYDVAVDLRVDSPTFGKYHAVILSESNKLMFYIPKGFAHGFLALTDEVEFIYKVDDIYNPKAERGIIWNDNDLAIAWPFEEYGIKEPKLSEKDKNLQTLKEIKNIL